VAWQVDLSCLSWLTPLCWQLGVLEPAFSSVHNSPESYPSHVIGPQQLASSFLRDIRTTHRQCALHNSLSADFDHQFGAPNERPAVNAISAAPAMPHR
jgi:hypothetical protein